jgi:hypothetical protein
VEGNAMREILASNPYAGHTFIQWVISFMIQIQALFIHFQSHHRGRLPYAPGEYRAHVRALWRLMNWFLNHPERGNCPKNTICP